MKHIEIFSSLHELNLAIPEIYRTILETLLDGFGIETGAVFAYRQSLDRIEQISCYGIEPGEEWARFNQFTERLSLKIAHQLIDRKDPFAIISTEELTAGFEGAAWDNPSGIKYVFVPLSYRDQLKGYVTLRFDALASPIDQDLALLDLYIRHVQLLFERACLNDEFARVKEEVSYQRKSIDALLSITQPGAEFPTIEQIFTKALGPIQEITGFSTVTIRLYDPERKIFRLMAQCGMTPEMIARLNCISAESPIFLEIMKKKGPAVKTPIALVQELGYKRTIFVPLVAGDAIVGSIDLPTKGDYNPTDDEFRWFALVGRMLGSMIYQAQLTERLQSMAVIQERTRLANELHDDVAQLVRSMKWGLDEARTTLENKQWEQTDRILENLDTMVQHTSNYLREEMLSLRERIDSNQGIIPILEGMLLRFEHNWGIKTALVTEREISTSHRIFLSSKEEIQLIRIVQEALMNIRRHARAHMVTIKISKEAEGVVFSIVDDGVGFRLEEIPQERLGLRIIRERAASVGATLLIDTIEGTGTVLKIKLPGYMEAPR